MEVIEHAALRSWRRMQEPGKHPVSRLLHRRIPGGLCRSKERFPDCRWVSDSRQVPHHGKPPISELPGHCPLCEQDNEVHVP